MITFEQMKKDWLYAIQLYKDMKKAEIQYHWKVKKYLKHADDLLPEAWEYLGNNIHWHRELEFKPRCMNCHKAMIELLIKNSHNFKTGLNRFIGNNEYVTEKRKKENELSRG